jgi:DNA polymerase III sliding clamp (beta) subunit (PCNA family)
MVGKAASTDAARVNLNSIHVTKDYTEATNGHILARVSVPFQWEREDLPEQIPTSGETLTPFIVPAKAAMSFKTFKAKGKYNNIPSLADALYVDVEKTNSNGAAYFTATDRESTINPTLQKIDMDFPDIDRVIPFYEGDDIFHVRLNISYLETLLAIAKGTGSEFVNIDGVKGNNRPLLLRTENNGQKFTDVIMPVRD